jgi:hypothetical protein
VGQTEAQVLAKCGQWGLRCRLGIPAVLGEYMDCSGEKLAGSKGRDWLWQGIPWPQSTLLGEENERGLRSHFVRVGLPSSLQSHLQLASEISKWPA